MKNASQLTSSVSKEFQDKLTKALNKDNLSDSRATQKQKVAI